MSPAAPPLRLPAALLQLWTESPPALAERLAGLAVAGPGVAPVAPNAWAFPPAPGDPAVFDRAVRVGQRLLAALGAEIGLGRVRALIAPGAVSVVDGKMTLLEDALHAELARKAPALVPDALHLTGHALRGLEGRWATAAGANLQVGSGRVVPTVVLGPPAPGLPPWRNPEVLARSLRWVPRPEPAQALAALLDQPIARLTGPIGVGKTRLAFEALRTAGRSVLWRRAGGEPGEPPPPLERALAAERQRPLWIVYDTLESADATVWREIELLAAHPDLDKGLHLLLIARAATAWNGAALAGAPELLLGPLGGEEWERFCFQAYHGLALPIGVSERLAARAAGNPFALEEALLYLVRDRQLRQVFGSFFFSGTEDRAEFHPSSRFRLHAEAEAARLGDPTPLRYLALASDAVPAAELGAATFAAGGATLEPGWEERAVAAGLLERRDGPWGSGLCHAWPAVSLALAGALEPAAAAEAKRTLGELLAARSSTAEESWGAWPLLAGTDDGARAALAAAGAAGTRIARDELYAALRDELASAGERSGDPALELDLLWALLPLARRLGRLHELESAIARGLELASGRPERFLAIAAVAAELLQKAGRFREAEATLRQALAAARDTDEKKKELLLIELGRVLVRQGRRAEAQELFAKTLAFAQRARRSSVEATCHFHLGNIALHEFRLDEATAQHEAALALRRAAGQAAAVATSLSALGAVGLAQGNYPAALARYQEAQAALEAESNEAEEAFALLGTGRALARLGDFAGAAPVLKRALQLRDGRDDSVGEAIARVALAEVHLELGQLELAHQEARKALFSLSIVPEVDARADAERVLGQVLLRQRRADEADARLVEAERIYRAAGNDFALLTVLALRLETAMAGGRVDAVAAAFDALAGERLRLPQIVSAALFDYPLSVGAGWLRDRRGDGADPRPYLEQAYSELLRQTGFLSPAMRQRFLFQIPAHAAILEAATQRGLSMPKI